MSEQNGPGDKLIKMQIAKNAQKIKNKKNFLRNKYKTNKKITENS